MSWRRRWLNILGLSMGWCLQVSIIFIQLSTSTLAARAYGGDAVSTLPAGIMMAAATLTATPGTLLMRTRGRRVVMLAPGLAAVVGAGLMAVAANYQLLWLLVVGSIPLGVSFAQANNLRFAALEFAPAGSEPQALSLVIQVHILCMFVPSLFTGHVIQLVSARWTMALGALLQLGGNAVFFAGRSLGIYFAGNAVVGLGWNWAYVGASALVAVSYQPQEKFLAQGVLDCGVLLATGIAVVLAGVLYAGIGWTSYISLFMGVNGFMVAMDVWLLLRLELPRVAAAMRRGRV
eukprot:XP_001693077.1 predicted protein [Chlamydomonas reinhardtii]